MNQDSFRDFILDQLGGLRGVICRPMFGGHGLYCDRTFFGIVHKGHLYLKTDERTRAGYVKKGMKPFRPHANQKLKSFYEVPVDIIEDPDQLTSWAMRATGGTK